MAYPRHTGRALRLITVKAAGQEAEDRIMGEAICGTGPPVGRRVDPAVLRPLVRLAALVTATRDHVQLIEAVAETAMELLGADSLALSQLDRAGRVLRTLINVGELAEGEQRWPTGETYVVEDFADTLGFLHGSATRRAWTHIDDADAEPAERRLLLSLGKSSSLKAPIVVDGQMWGELWAARGARVPRFDALDGDLASIISGLVSAGLSQAAAYQAMERLARTDAMTGLANRRALDEHLAHHVATAPVISLAVGDINGLKAVNDTMGHASGDDALLHVARAASAVIAGFPGAVAVRLGGDEFALLLPGLDIAAAAHVARGWCAAARHPWYGTSLSCGVSSTSDGCSHDAQQLLSAADRAQYHAKRGRIVHEPVLSSSLPGH